MNIQFVDREIELSKEPDPVAIGDEAVTLVECKWADLDAREGARVLASLKEKASLVKFGGTSRKDSFIIAARSAEPVPGATVMTLADIERAGAAPRIASGRIR